LEESIIRLKDVTGPIKIDNSHYRDVPQAWGSQRLGLAYITLLPFVGAFANSLYPLVSLAVPTLLLPVRFTRFFAASFLPLFVSSFPVSCGERGLSVN
jgi:hypothetical protein